MLHFLWFHPMCRKEIESYNPDVKTVNLYLSYRDTAATSTGTTHARCFVWWTSCSSSTWWIVFSMVNSLATDSVLSNIPKPRRRNDTTLWSTYFHEWQSASFINTDPLGQFRSTILCAFYHWMSLTKRPISLFGFGIWYWVYYLLVWSSIEPWLFSYLPYERVWCTLSRAAPLRKLVRVSAARQIWVTGGSSTASGQTSIR